jgi:hypothetical protein
MSVPEARLRILGAPLRSERGLSQIKRITILHGEPLDLVMRYVM